MGADEVQAPVTDSPAVETPSAPDGQVAEGGVETVDWEARAKEHQAWGTKNAQRVRELEERTQILDAWNSDDPEAQMWAAEQLGIQLEDEGADSLGEQYAQLDPRLQQQLEALIEQQNAQQMSQQEQQQYQAFRQDIDPELSKLGVPDEMLDMVAEVALDLPGVETPVGLRPDLEGAVAQIEQLVLKASKLPQVKNKLLGEYRDSKEAPHFSSAGVAGTQVPDLDHGPTRRAWMAEQLNSQD